MIVMDEVRGVSLRALLAARPLSLAATIAVGCQLADALHYTHQLRTPRGEPLGLLHRRLSPDEIYVDRGGRLQVLGFEHMAPGKPTRPLDYSGPLYWAPELCRGLPLDLRADLFSAALILYEASTGHYPFPLTSLFDNMLGLAKHDAAPPSSRRTHYPAELERMLLSALSRHPSRRQESALQLRLELEALAESLGIDHRSYPRRPLAELVAERG
jgi:serine/threonine protein kinase